MILINLVMPNARAKHEFLFNEQASRHRGRFVEQKPMLSASFRYDQIYICHRYNFGHTLLCCLSRTYLFNKHATDVQNQKNVRTIIKVDPKRDEISAEPEVEKNPPNFCLFFSFPPMTSSGPDLPLRPTSWV
jgi:hypothetical protein